MIAVNPASVHALVVTAPSTAVKGQPFTYMVTAKDLYGNTVTSYTDLVHFVSSDPHGVLPVDSALIKGTGSFTAKLNTAGSQYIKGTDTANAQITGKSAAISVN